MMKWGWGGEGRANKNMFVAFRVGAAELSRSPLYSLIQVKPYFMEPRSSRGAAFSAVVPSGAPRYLCLLKSQISLNHRIYVFLT